jgi:uncharacterized protein YjbJ (UPF0337 family)
MTNSTSKPDAPLGQPEAQAPVRRNVDAMTAGGMAEARGRPQTIRRKDIHDRWQKITDQEAEAMTGKPDLVHLIQARYGMSQQQAENEVDAWAKKRVF